MRGSSTTPIRVVVVAHSSVVPSNRARWERLAEQHPDSDVTLIAPALFRTDRLGGEQVFRPKFEERGNYRVLPIPTTTRRLYRSFSLGLRRVRPQVLQVNEEPTEWVLLQSFLVARILAPKAVRLFYYYTNILTAPDRWHRKTKLRVIFRLADAAFAGSEDSARVLRALGLARPVFIQTEIGADERVWTPWEESAPGRPLTIGFIGSLVPQKGVADLARAAAALGGDWRLVVVGDGPERRTLEGILQNVGLRDRLDLRGVVPRDALPALMRQLDVLVLPSRTIPPLREQFGLVLAEAMLSGVAVVGSSSGAIPEVIGDGGLVFPEGDWHALRVHLQSLADDPGRRAEIAARGRDRALRLYSATALADQTYELYRELVRSGHRRSSG